MLTMSGILSPLMIATWRQVKNSTVLSQAMGSIDYKDLTIPPKKTRETTVAMVANAVHLARLLKVSKHPGRHTVRQGPACPAKGSTDP